MGFPGGSDGKEFTCNTGDLDSIPGWGRSPGEGNGRKCHRRQPTRLPRPWDSPGKNIGVGCHFLLQCMKVTDSFLSVICSADLFLVNC